MLKFDQLKLRTAVKQCQAFLSLIDPFDVLAKHGELTLALHPMKIPDGLQIMDMKSFRRMSRTTRETFTSWSPYGSWASYYAVIVIILPLSKLCIYFVMRYAM